MRQRRVIVNAALRRSRSVSTALTNSLHRESPPVTNVAPLKKRVLIVGGGFAGIAAARALKRADVEVLLVDRRNHHIFQPLLYQVATAVLSPAEIATPIRQLESKQKNLNVLLAEVKGINCEARTVDTISPDRPSCLYSMPRTLLTAPSGLRAAGVSRAGTVGVRHL